MLFHISEESGIGRFEPRAAESSAAPAVWAIDARRLINYLVPRECPRVTYYAGRETSPGDVERFPGPSQAGGRRRERLARAAAVLPALLLPPAAGDLRVQPTSAPATS